MGGKVSIFAAGLLVAVFLAYQPAWQGGFIWDDDAHVTRPELRSWQGLYRIWFDIGATQQYYPLLHSVFWVEHKLWGDATLGYHLVNILLHAAAALLVALILRRLAIPGAYLAAAIFALHPVQVESVAWITELKNTLSAVFYLAAALVYLRSTKTRRPPLYWRALALFVLGLLSKTVTATLPAALLVIFWWQRGRLSWRRDVLPLVPFFVLGAAAGMFTAWVERKLIGAEGPAFDLTLIERCLIAGRAIWFYLGKLFWPGDLIFIYPRWQVSQAVWWQYLFPAAALLLLAVLWCCGGGGAGRWRDCCSSSARCSRCWASSTSTRSSIRSWPITSSTWRAWGSSPGSAGVALLLERWRLWRRPAGYVLCLGLLAILGRLDLAAKPDVRRHRNALPDDASTANPDCWMAHNNLGVRLGRPRADRRGHGPLPKALEIKPDCAEAHNNLGQRPGEPRAVRRGHRPIPEGAGDRARLRPGP